jgi:hypothetical protein
VALARPKKNNKQLRSFAPRHFHGGASGRFRLFGAQEWCCAAQKWCKFPSFPSPIIPVVYRTVILYVFL